MKPNPFKIFYSYSHKDEVLQEQLETHLSILKRKGLIDDWHDRKILPGTNWENIITNEIEQSEVILLLISSDFIASDYCYSKEMHSALKLHETGKAIVIPIIIRPVEWEDAPFSNLQALPKNAQPITSWENQDEAWVDVVKGIKATIAKQKKARERSSEGEGLIDINQILKKEFDRIVDVCEKNTSCGGMCTGFNDLDKVIDGIHQTDFILVGGRSGMGKTDFAINIAATLTSQEEKAVAFFSLKHPAEVITRRLISSLSNISCHSLLRGEIRETDWPRLTRATGISTKLPLFIDDRANIKFKDIEIEIHKIHEKNELGLIIIDNLYNLQVNETMSHHEISHNLKIISREYKIPILCLSPLSSDIEHRPNKRPLIKDLNEWQCIEEDSSVILFMYRDEAYNKSPDNPNLGITEIIVTKNNYGQTGTIKLAYIPSKSSFQNIAVIEV